MGVSDVDGKKRHHSFWLGGLWGRFELLRARFVLRALGGFELLFGTGNVGKT